MNEQTKWIITTILTVVTPLAAVVLNNYLEQRKPFIKRKSDKNKR